MRKIESIDGVRVLSQEPAHAPHPHPDQGGRIVPFTNVSHLLMEDGVELYACDVCGKPDAKVQSVVAHLASHSRSGPNTPVEMIKKVLLAVRAVDPHNERHRYRIAADELNRHGHTTFHGNEWTAGSVGNIYRTYADQYPDVQPAPVDRRRRRAMQTAATATTATSSGEKCGVTTAGPVDQAQTTTTTTTATTAAATVTPIGAGKSGDESDLDRLERIVTHLSDNAVVIAEVLNNATTTWDRLSNGLMEARRIIMTLRKNESDGSLDPRVHDALVTLQQLISGGK